MKTLAVAAILAAAVAAALLLLPVREAVVAALDWSQGNPLRAGAVFAAATVAFVPFWILAIGTGFLLGPWTGAATAFAGNLAGGLVAWLASRTLARRAVDRALESRPRLRSLAEAARARGFLLVLLTRLSPLIPSNFMNWAFGACGVSCGAFALGSALGMLPTLAAYTYLGTTLASLSDVATRRVASTPFERVFLAAGLAVTIAVTVWIVRWATRALPLNSVK